MSKTPFTLSFAKRSTSSVLCLFHSEKILEISTFRLKFNGASSGEVFKYLSLKTKGETFIVQGLDSVQFHEELGQVNRHNLVQERKADSSERLFSKFYTGSFSLQERSGSEPIRKR